MVLLRAIGGDRGESLDRYRFALLAMLSRWAFLAAVQQQVVGVPAEVASFSGALNFSGAALAPAGLPQQ